MSGETKVAWYDCNHERLHYMGCGPLPHAAPDCRWNYVCLDCRNWLKYKRPIVVRADGRHGLKLEEPAYRCYVGNGPGEFGVPKKDALYAWGAGWVIP